MTFLPSDLGIQDAALSQITARLANGANPDPINDAIARQVQRVNDYTLRYLIDDARLKRLTQSLVLWDLHTKMGPVPSNIEAAYKDAIQELTDIRDGKFADLISKPVADPELAPPRASWGSDKKIC